MRLDLWPALPACCLSLLIGTANGRAPEARPDYRDPALSVERRVDDLLARLTLEEKVARMICLWSAKGSITDAQGRFDPTRAPRWFRTEIGRIERPSDGHGARAEAEYTNAIQRWVRENTRLGIPVIFHEEALHGLQGAEATSFPQAIALASSWNPDLVRRVFKIVALEGLIKCSPQWSTWRVTRVGADRGDLRRRSPPRHPDGSGGGSRLAGG